MKSIVFAMPKGWQMDPPLPSATRPTAGFAQPAGCGGAPHAVRNPASPPRGEASIWLAALDYHQTHLPTYFTLTAHPCL